MFDIIKNRIVAQSIQFLDSLHAVFFSLMVLLTFILGTAAMIQFKFFTKESTFTSTLEYLQAVAHESSKAAAETITGSTQSFNYTKCYIQ